MSDGFSPNSEMKKEALKGLAWRKELNRGGTMVGVARARDIANGANLSLDTVKRMKSFFARHEVDKEAEGFRPGEKGYPSNGRIAWALWGGDAGKSWVSAQLEISHNQPFIFPEDEEFLAHFGVKGMKWGVVNKKKPNSSGVSKEKTKQEKRNAKADVYVKKAAVYDAEIKKNAKAVATLQAEKNKTKNTLTRARINKKQTVLRESSSELSEKKKQALLDAEAKKQGKLSAKQKKVAKGAAITAGVLAAYGVYTTVESGEATRSIAKGKALLSGKDGILFNTNQKLSRRMSVDEIMTDVVPQINPGYGGFGTKMNCRRATYAYELRRRGYDVKATKSTRARGQNLGGVLNAQSDSTKNYVPSSGIGTIGRAVKEKAMRTLGIAKKTPLLDEIEANALRGGGRLKSIGIDVFGNLKDQPDGARGEIAFMWEAGGGHSVAWEKISGVVHVFDTQSGKAFTNLSDLLADYPTPKPNATTFQRLDDVALNTDFLLRWAQNA